MNTVALLRSAVAAEPVGVTFIDQVGVSLAAEMTAIRSSGSLTILTRLR